MIDTHQHLIYPDLFSYQWAAGVPALNGRFTLEQYATASAGCGIEGTLFMEVDVDEGQAPAEAKFFCSLASDPRHRILGVIASGRPENEGFGAYLESLAHPRLKGIRRVLHTQPDALSQSRRFRENLALLPGFGLTFDLCVLQRQLPVALDLVRSCPHVMFILDHCGVPEITTNEAPDGEGFRWWREHILLLGRESNLQGKISGLTAYAGGTQRTASALAPYVDTMIEAFGPGRLVWGGDWPVVNLGSGLSAWRELTLQLLSRLDPLEQNAILSGNARRIYSLNP